MNSKISSSQNTNFINPISILGKLEEIEKFFDRCFRRYNLYYNIRICDADYNLCLFMEEGETNPIQLWCEENLQYNWSHDSLHDYETVNKEIRFVAKFYFEDPNDKLLFILKWVD